MRVRNSRVTMGEHRVRIETDILTLISRGKLMYSFIFQVKGEDGEDITPTVALRDLNAGSGRPHAAKDFQKKLEAHHHPSHFARNSSPHLQVAG